MGRNKLWRAATLLCLTSALFIGCDDENNDDGNGMGGTGGTVGGAGGTGGTPMGGTPMGGEGGMGGEPMGGMGGTPMGGEGGMGGEPMGGEGGMGGNPMPPNDCEAYCDLMGDNCPDVFGDRDTCLSTCALYPDDGDINDVDGNTLQCRIYHAGVAADDAVLHCPHAAAEGGGACGSYCEVYCDLLDTTCQGENAQYESRDACLSACETIPTDGDVGAVGGDSVQCRIYHGGVPATADAALHCPHAGEDGAGVCALPPTAHEEPDSLEAPVQLVFNRFGEAQANFTLDPEGDNDYFIFTLAEPVDMAIAISSLNGEGACEDDTLVALHPFGGEEALVTNDDFPGIEEACSFLAAGQNPEMVRVPAGDHVIRAWSRDGVPTGELSLFAVQLPPLENGEPCGNPDDIQVCGYDAYCAPGEEEGVSVCTANVCGDGVIAGDETCDDGNDVDGDGCDACQIVGIPTGNGCDPEHEVYLCNEAAYCGENAEAGEGDPAFICIDHVCGDLIVGPEETCDDGNEEDGDGCEACQLVGIPIGNGCEPGGYLCVPEAYCGENAEAGEGDPAFVCTAHVCGDEIIGPAEECDVLEGELCDNCVVQLDMPRHEEIDSREEPYRLNFNEEQLANALFQINPTGDVDWFIFTLPEQANVTVSTRSYTGEGCEGDTIIDVYTLDGEEPFVRNDDAPFGNPNRPCSLASPDGHPELGQLPAGDYLIRVTPFAGFGGPPAPEAMNIIEVSYAVVGIGDPCDDAMPCPAEGYCPEPEVGEGGEGGEPEPVVCVAHVCGDGIVGFEEECDDANDDDTDGCTSECVIQPIAIGDACDPAGFPCVEEAYCGDLVIEEKGVEPAFVCIEHVCGDGIVGPGEACDDGNEDEGDGCNNACEIAAIVDGNGCDPLNDVFVCGEGSFCAPAEPAEEGDPLFACAPIVCGDGFVAGDETCEDGNEADGDGCDSACQLEPGDAFNIPAPGDYLRFADALVEGGPQWDRPSAACSGGGDADHYFRAYQITNNTEVPHRVNVTGNWDFDGYLHIFNDPFDPAVLDGCITGDDDFINTRASQVLDIDIAAGQTLVIVASTFSADTLGNIGIEVFTQVPPECGDEVVEGDEQCDDGNEDDTDGCNAECVIVPIPEGAACDPVSDLFRCGEGLFCTEGEGGAFVCGLNPCGNGVIDAEAGETCEDGNTEDGDGCSEVCQLEDAPLQIASPGGTVLAAGELAEGGPQWARPSTGCVADANVDHYFQAFRIVNRTGYDQRITATGNWDGFDGYLHVYRAPFVPDDYENCIRGNDDFEFNQGLSQLTDVVILDGEELVLVASTFGANATGDILLDVYTEEGVCGDGLIAADEACDDGNEEDGDGCSALCAIEDDAALSIPSPGERSFVGGALAEGDAQWQRPGAACSAGFGAADEYYDVYRFVNDSDATQRIDVTGRWSFDGYLHVFNDVAPFEADNLDNCIAGDDDFLRPGQTLASRGSLVEEIELLPGQVVTVVASSFSGGVTGAYSVEVYTRTPPVCGDGLIEGDEQCDPGAELPAPELCNPETCEFVTNDAAEPDTGAEPYNVEFDEDGRFGIVAEITPVGDQDWFAFTLPVMADIYVETFSAVALNTCNGDTYGRLYMAGDLESPIADDDDDGPGFCPAIDPVSDEGAMRAPAGDYVFQFSDLGDDGEQGYNVVRIWYVPYVGAGEECGPGLAMCDAGECAIEEGAETGTCEAVGGVAPAPGDLIITEIMKNPATVADADGEWFEVYNASDNPIEMQGVTIADNDEDNHIIASSVVVPAGGYAVFGINADMAVNGGIAVDYQYADFFLGNGTDEVVLYLGEVELDRVEFSDGPFPDTSGASMQLGGAPADADNNDGANWCDGVEAYDIVNNNLGTPGAANGICEVIEQ